MSFRDLVAKIGFEVHDEPLDRVEKKLDQIKERLEFLAAAEVIAKIGELIEKFSTFAEELHVAATSAGLTVEEFQKLAFAAGQSAVSQDEMSGAMARLSRNLYQARQGSEEAQKIFMQAGFTGEQIKGFKTGGDAMLGLADRFKDIQDPIQKQAIAMQLLGRGSVNMVGFLSQGSAAIKGMGDQAEKLGAILSGQQVEALVKVEHAMHEISAVFKVVGATIASYFAPSVETLIHSLLKFYEVNRKLIETNIKAWVWDITYALGFIYEAVRIVIQKFLDFAATHQTLVRRVSEFIVALGVLVGAIWAAQKVLSVFSGAFDILMSVISPFQFLWTKIFAPLIGWVANLAVNAFLSLISVIGEMVAVIFPSLGAAILEVGEVLEAVFLASPIGLIVAGIAALVVVIHDLWTILTGGSWESTWIAKAFEAAKSFGGKALGFLGLGGDDKAQTDSAAGALTKQQNLPSIAQGISNMNDLGNIGNSSPSVAGPGSMIGSNNSYTISAPISIEVPAGTDHKQIADKVKEGISDHLDRVYRRTQQSFLPSQAY